MKLKPKPIDEKINVISGKPILLKTDTHQIVEYANEYFIKLCEYNEGELIGDSLALLYHPRMPRTILNIAYQDILKKRKVYSIVRFISKTGKYFWLQIKFDFKVNEETRKTENIYLYGSPVSKSAINNLTIIYDRLDKIEKESNIEIAQKYFNNYLENLNIDYDKFFDKFLTI